MSDNPIDVKINFDLEARRATSAVDALNTRLSKAKTELRQLATEAKQTPIGLGNLERGAKGASQELTKLRSAINNVDDKTLSKGVKTLTDDLRKLEIQTEKTQAVTKKGLVSGVSLTPGGFASTEAIGQFERPAKGLGGALSGLGGGAGVGSALSLSAEISGSIEDIGKLASSIGDLRKEGASGALVLGALGLGLTALTFVSQQAKVGLDDFIETQKAARQRQQELNQELQGLTSQQDIDRLRTANSERRQQILDEIAAIEQARDENTNTRIRAVADSDLIKAATLDVFGTTGKALDLLGVNTDNADDRLKELNEELQTVDDSTAQLNSQLAALSAQAKEAAAATSAQLSLNRQFEQISRFGSLEDLVKLRQSAEVEASAIQETLRQKTSELNQAILEQARLIVPEIDEILQGIDPAQRKQVLLDTIAEAGQQLLPGTIALSDEIDNLNRRFFEAQDIIVNAHTPALIEELEQRKLAIDTLEEQTKAAEELAKEEKELSKARGSALTALQDARKELADFDKQLTAENERRAREDDRNLQRKALRDQIDAAKELERQESINERIQEARTKAAADIKAQDDKFKAENLKAEKDYGKERLKIIKDTNRKKADAELENDVNAFIAAEQSGAEQLSELDQNFQDEQDERKRQHEESLQNLRQQLAEKERVELATRQQTLTRSQQLERQLAALEEQFKVEDAKRELTIAQELSRTKRQILITEVNEARNILRLLQSSAARAAAIAGVRQGVNNAASAISNALSGVIPSFANGVMGLDKPIIARIGDAPPGWEEAVVPYRKSEGLQGGLNRMGKSKVENHFHLSVGEHVTPTDIENLKAAIIQAEMQHYEAVS